MKAISLGRPTGEAASVRGAGAEELAPPPAAVLYTDIPFLRQAGAGLAAIVIVVVLAIAWLALRAPGAPAALPASAPAAQFSAGRAAGDMAWLAQKPRPVASAANREARDWIVARLSTLGMAAQVQTSNEQSTSLDTFMNADVMIATVNNIVARRPGTAPDHARRPALLLAVHYDTAAQSVGAADVGAPVAAVLETLRALPPLANDLVVLFADGQHARALGAAAFAARHPWARDIGLVLQFEARGMRGPLMLYDTSGANGAAIAGWVHAAPLPLGSSLMHELRQVARPNALARVGQAGLYFTNVDGAPDARGSLDTVDRFDTATLQHLGETMLAVTRHFGSVPLAPIARADHVWFTLPLVGMVHYPRSWIWPITRLVCLLFVGVYCLGLQRHRVQQREVVKGAIAFVLIGAMMSLSSWLLWIWAPGLHDNYQPDVDGATSHDSMYLIAYITLACATYIYLQRRVQEVIGAATAALGAMLAMTLLLVLASALAPGATYLLAWPLFGVLFAHAALMIWPAGGARRTAMLLAGMVPALLLIAPVVRDVYGVFSPERISVPIALFAILLGMGTTLLASLQRRFAVRGLVAATVALMLVASTPQPLDAGSARANQLIYFKDAFSWKSYWTLPPNGLADWNRHYFPDAVAPRQFIEAYRYQGRRWIAPAPRTQVEYPYIVMLKDDDEDTIHRVEFTVASKNRAPTVVVRVEGAYPRRTWMNGRQLTATDSVKWITQVHGMGDTPLHFTLDMQPGKPFRIYVEERIPGLPREAPLQLAAGAPRLTPLTETTVTSDTLLFR